VSFCLRVHISVLARLCWCACTFVSVCLRVCISVHGSMYQCACMNVYNMFRGLRLSCAETKDPLPLPLPLPKMICAYCLPFHLFPGLSVFFSTVFLRASSALTNINAFFIIWLPCYSRSTCTCRPRLDWMAAWMFEGNKVVHVKNKVNLSRKF